MVEIDDLPMIIRVNEAFVVAIRRILRLVQLSASNGMASDGRSAASVHEPQGMSLYAYTHVK